AGRGAPAPVRHGDRAVAELRARSRLHRTGRVVAEESPSGSGGVVVPGAQGRLRVRRRVAGLTRRTLQVRPLVLSLHRLSRAGPGVRAVLPLLIQISTATHYALYHDWRKSLDFCRALPDIAPPEPVMFHMFWRERSGGWWPRVRRFGRKQALPVKA